MLKEFVSLGKWWLPNNPEVILPGKLSFSPENGTKLELIGSFYSSQFEEISQVENGVVLDFIKPEEIIILGLLDNNEEITLYKCFGKIKNYEFVKSRANLLFDVEYIFRKIHFKNEQDIKLKSISIQYSYLEQWIGKSGLQASFSQEENKVSMSYQGSIPLFHEYKCLEI